MVKRNYGQAIPRNRQRQCEYCKGAVDANATGTFQHAEGWLENRIAGGANAIALPIRHERWACGKCIGKMRDGVHWSQERLFDLSE